MTETNDNDLDMVGVDTNALEAAAELFKRAALATMAKQFEEQGVAPAESSMTLETSEESMGVRADIKIIFEVKLTDLSEDTDEAQTEN